MARTGRKRKQIKVSIPGRLGVSVVIAKVDDPFEPGQSIAVARNVLASPLAAIHARGRLVGPNDTEADGWARKLAGDWFSSVYERAEMSDAKAIDYSAVKVDTSPVYDGLSGSQVWAFQQLKQMASELGRFYGILYAIVGRQMWFEEYAQQRAQRHPSRTDRLDTYAELREALDALIDYRGVAVGRKSPIRVVHNDGPHIDRDCGSPLEMAG